MGAVDVEKVQTGVVIVVEATVVVLTAIVRGRDGRSTGQWRALDCGSEVAVGYVAERHCNQCPHMLIHWKDYSPHA